MTNLTEQEKIVFEQEFRRLYPTWADSLDDLIKRCHRFAKPKKAVKWLTDKQTEQENGNSTSGMDQ